MEHGYWGWLLWIGIWFLLMSSLGHWGYSYRANRRYFNKSNKTSIELLNERYARGDIDRDEFIRIKTDITAT